jgi:hypothetical protein
MLRQLMLMVDGGCSHLLGCNNEAVACGCEKIHGRKSLDEHAQTGGVGRGVRKRLLKIVLLIAKDFRCKAAAALTR